MEFVSETEFLRRNDLVVNRRVRKLLLLSTLSGPIIAIGRFFEVFDTAYIQCLMIWVLTIGAYVLVYYLEREEKYYKYAKYSGLIGIELIIGLMAAHKSIGIHITYGLIPLMSCMYIDIYLTRRICSLSYVVMIGSLYIRSFGATTFDYPSMTQKEWFISQSLGFSVEFVLITIGVCSLVKYLKGILNDSYQLGKEKVYSQEASQVKNAFLVNLSKELRQPLDEVGEVSEILLKEECMSQETKKQVEQIAKRNEVLYTFLEDIEDFAKLKLDRIMIIEEMYDFNELISDISETIKSRIGDKNIDLHVVVNPSIPKYLCGDRLRIRQILINLLNNTVKYMEDGFIILRIDWKKRSDLAILNIEVMDTGYGIEEEAINLLFESFCKLELEGEDNIEGIGLGLPICKKLCEMMEGKIEVRNGYGRGSLFTVTLPQKITDDYHNEQEGCKEI